MATCRYRFDANGTGGGTWTALDPRTGSGCTPPSVVAGEQDGVVVTLECLVGENKISEVEGDLRGSRQTITIDPPMTKAEFKAWVSTL